MSVSKDSIEEINRSSIVMDKSISVRQIQIRACICVYWGAGKKDEIKVEKRVSLWNYVV